MGNACTRCWYNKVSHVEHGLVLIAGKWGLFVAKHPLLVILCSLVCALLMSTGVIFIEEEINTFELYAPENSVSFQNWKRYINSWGNHEDQIQLNQFFVTAKNNDNLKSQQNIFTAENLSELLKIHELIMELEVEENGNVYSFDDLCFTYPNGNCAINSILSFYDFNQTKLQNEFNETKILYPSQFSAYSDTNALMVLLLGQDILVNDEDEVIASAGLSMGYNLDATLYEDACREWELLFIDLLADFQSDYFDVFVYGYNSFDLELEAAVGNDLPSFLLSFVLIGVFAAFILIRVKTNDTANGCKYKLDSKRNRCQLSIMGIFSTLFAILVDDMFVLLRAYELTDPSKSVDERIVITMERGGVSILFTSITDLVAFSIGSFSPFNAVSAFCVYAGVGVVLDFLFQVTFFLAVMVFDSKPEYFLCCCCTCGDKSKETDDNETNNKSTVEMTVATDTNVKELQVSTKVDLNDTNVLLNYMINPEAASVVMKKLGDLILGSIVVKLSILFTVILYLIGALYGSMGIYADQDPGALINSDSYLSTFFDMFSIYFDQIGRPMDIVLDKPLDYSNETVQNRLNEFVNDLQSDECFESEEYLTNFWLDSYRDYLDDHYGNMTIDSSLFYDVLYSEYLPSEHGEQYLDDIWNTVVIDNKTILDAQTIGASSYQFINKSKLRISVAPKGFDTGPFAECLDNWHSMERKYQDLGVYYWFWDTVLAESDLITIQQTIQNLAYASAAALIITLILIPYPKMTIFVMTTVAQILFGVLGYMSLWGLLIDTTTMIWVVLSIGFSIDNAAHFCHAFTTAPIKDIPHVLSAKQERKARVLFALNSVGMPIVAGDLSTIVALLPLAGSKSGIFLAFWKCISLVMLFGAGYSILYLPAVLSMVGPVGIDDVLNEEQEMANQIDKHSKATGDKVEETQTNSVETNAEIVTSS